MIFKEKAVTKSESRKVYYPRKLQILLFHKISFPQKFLALQYINIEQTARAGLIWVISDL